MAEPRRALARDILQRGMARGDIRPDIDVDFVVDHLIGPFFARYITGPPHSAGWADQVVSVIWPGIANH
ncbi:MAG: TetR/AcrR family transcriptional regulator C-terminal ligand-binding domain-containing protein [Catenulispora sp.]|nr:TetR/AcrR family transcriptional regulator C-terminal ligand-binding domain-containing protein [Catenulispora sp.]